MQSHPKIADHPILFLDYDGTLAPIVEHPREALPHPDVPSLLQTLIERHPVWIVTGRKIETLARFFSLPLPAIGIHGVEKGIVGGPVELLIDSALRDDFEEARRHVPQMQGVRIEEKLPTFAVHFREAEDPEEVSAALGAWAGNAPPNVEAVWGKMVVELRPRGSSKGHAVLGVIAEAGNRTAVYIGDDTSDEDAFRMLEEPAITIKVGPGPSAARYRLPDVDAVVAYLRNYAR